MLEPLDYRYQMVARNHLPCFLSMELRRIDDILWIYCPINGLISLRQRLERDRLSEGDLLHFFRSVEQLCKDMEEYLLPFEGVILDPDFVYVRPDNMCECYWFYGKEEDGLGAENFLEYLLDHLNFEDQQGVKMMYSVYQASRGRAGGIEVLRDAARQQMGKAPEPVALPASVVSESKATIPKIEWEPAISTLPIMENKALLRCNWKSWLEDIRSWLKKRFLPKQNLPLPEKWSLQSEIEPEPVYEGTTLLTGGMMGGGVYCLRARNLSLPDLLLTSYPFFVGKDENRMDGVVQDAYVSRYHARIDREGEEIRVMDLGSTNGTFVNRERLQPYESRVLREGDLLFFAQREYEFCFLR